MRSNEMGHGLEFPNVVDLVGVSDERREVVLIVVGPDIWSDSDRERELLKQKLEWYLAFVDSGQLYRSYAQVRDYAVHFQIDTTTPLPILLRAWVQRFGEILLRDHGVLLKVMQI